LYSWNDSRLAALNEGADLPDAAIELTYYPGKTPGTVLLLKDALSNYSDVFKQELEAAKGLFENMKPNATGHAYSTYSNPERLVYVRVRVSGSLGPRKTITCLIVMRVNGDGDGGELTPLILIISGVCLHRTQRTA
jgi:hypothetical protein